MSVYNPMRAASGGSRHTEVDVADLIHGSGSDPSGSGIQSFAQPHADAGGPGKEKPSPIHLYKPQEKQTEVCAERRRANISSLAHQLTNPTAGAGCNKLHKSRATLPTTEPCKRQNPSGECPRKLDGSQLFAKQNGEGTTGDSSMNAQGGASRETASTSKVGWSRSFACPHYFSAPRRSAGTGDAEDWTGLSNGRQGYIRKQPESSSSPSTSDSGGAAADNPGSPPTSPSLQREPDRQANSSNPSDGCQSLTAWPALPRGSTCRLVSLQVGELKHFHFVASAGGAPLSSSHSCPRPHMTCDKARHSPRRPYPRNRWNRNFHQDLYGNWK